MSVSEDFISILWDDLERNQDDSFLFKFLENRMEERKSENNRKNRDDIFTSVADAALDELLGFLADPKKKLQIKGNLKNRYEKWLKTVLGELEADREIKGLISCLESEWKQEQKNAGNSGENGAGKETKRSRVQFKKDLEMLKNPRKQLNPLKNLEEKLCEQDEIEKPVSEENLKTLRDIVRRAALVQEGRNLLLNLGFHKNKEKKKKVRNKNLMLKMLDEWCESESYVLDRREKASEEEWKNLVRQLRQDAIQKRAEQLQKGEKPEFPKLILPVKIDPATGISLCLVGLGLFEDRQQVKRLVEHPELENYVFVCFGPYECTENGTDSISMELIMMYHPATTFEEGKNLFFQILNGTTDSFGFFQDTNGYPPDPHKVEIPEQLRIYFDFPEENEKNKQPKDMAEKPDLKTLVEAGEEDYMRDSEALQKNMPGRP